MGAQLFAALAAEFPREAVHWRAQTLTKTGDKALALAYIDARDVMDRLDAVCTPAGWSNDCIETPKGRVIGKISILIDGQWVTKTDGAGDTDVEGEKGGISDALKRAAVLWGIGRYLYRLPSVWAPCESYERNGKLTWKAWRGSPWNAVKSVSAAAISQAEPVVDDGQRSVLETLLEQTGTSARAFYDHYGARDLRDFPAASYEDARKILSARLSPEQKAA